MDKELKSWIVKTRQYMVKIKGIYPDLVRLHGMMNGDVECIRKDFVRIATSVDEMNEMMNELNYGILPKIHGAPVSSFTNVKQRNLIVTEFIPVREALDDLIRVVQDIRLDFFMTTKRGAFHEIPIDVIEKYMEEKKLRCE